MNLRFLSAIVTGLALSLGAAAQDSSSAQAPAQSPGRDWQSQRGGRGGMGGGFGMGRGLMGTVTEVAADHYTIKTETGETYTVHFSANTRILKQGAGRGPGTGGPGEGRPGGGAGEDRGGGGGGRGMGGNPPEIIKATDIKVGDAIGAMGEVDVAAKSVGAVTVVKMDPERARQMEEYAQAVEMARGTAGLNTTVPACYNSDK